MSVIDLTELMAERQANPHPCDGCEAGYGSIGQWTDPKTGHFMQESHDCTEDCQKLREYNPTKISSGPFFGQNIGDAIRIIKGK